MDSAWWARGSPCLRPGQPGGLESGLRIHGLQHAPRPLRSTALAQIQCCTTHKEPKKAKGNPREGHDWQNAILQTGDTRPVTLARPGGKRRGGVPPRDSLRMWNSGTGRTDVVGLCELSSLCHLPSAISLLGTRLHLPGPEPGGPLKR